MVKSPHEALHRIFQKDTHLFARTLERLHQISVPTPDSVSVLNVDLTETEPLERRVDTVLMAESQAGKYILAIESQGKPDEAKRASWCYYIAHLHAKYQCPVMLLVASLDAATAKWAREPIMVGLLGTPSMIVMPIALGPDNVPPVLDPVAAREDIVFSVFSALTHARSREVAAILKVLAAALNSVDVQTAGFFAEFVGAGLGDVRAREMWRALMTSGTYRYQSEFADTLRAEGEARTLLLMLERRGIPVPQAARDRIQSCTDTGTLDGWVERALTISSIDQLFDSASEA